MGRQAELFVGCVALVSRFTDDPPPRLLGYEWHRLRRVDEDHWLFENGKILMLEEWWS